MTSKRLKNLKLKKNKNIPFISDAEFSTHELIGHLLTQTGPSAVRISSFSISEIAIRNFFRLQESRQITQLSCLFDFSVKRHKLGLLFFASNVASCIRLTKVHAKLIFIDNEEWNLVVVTSANLNNNDKKEVGIIITSPELYSFYSTNYNQWFEDALNVSPNEFN